MDRKRITELKVRASFTVEAAAVVPIVLVLVAGMILAAFFVHDSVTFRASGLDLLIENAETVKEKEGEDGLSGGGPINGQFLYSRDASLSIEPGKSGLSVTGSADFPVPFTLAGTLLGESAQNINIGFRISHLDARKELLGYKALSDGADMIQNGLNE